MPSLPSSETHHFGPSGKCHQEELSDAGFASSWLLVLLCVFWCFEVVSSVFRCVSCICYLPVDGFCGQ